MAQSTPTLSEDLFVPQHPHAEVYNLLVTAAPQTLKASASSCTQLYSIQP